MKNTFHKGTNFLILVLSTLVLSFIPCYADTNVSPGYMCSPEADNSTTVSDSFKTNLNNLLDSLAANVLQSGFYKAAVGKNSNKIYGLIQCRGDVSPNNCANCTNESIKVALHNCTNSMWYHDFQFYSNISTPYSAGGRRLWHGVVGVSMTVLSTLTVQTVL